MKDYDLNPFTTVMKQIYKGWDLDRVLTESFDDWWYGHEGWGFNRKNSSSLGSGIYPQNNQQCKKIAKNMKKRPQDDKTKSAKKAQRRGHW